MKKVIVLAVCLSFLAFPLRVYAGMPPVIIHICHHTTGGGTGGHFEGDLFIDPGFVFTSAVFGLAFAIGHDHWLGCKQSYPTHSESDELGRAVCQGSWNWPMKVKTVGSQLGGNGGNLVGGIDK